MRRRVAVTGLGLATPLGCDVERVWERLLAGESGVTAPIRHADRSPPMRAVGEMKPEDLDALRTEHPEAAASGELRTLLGVAAGTRAIRDAGLDDGEPHPRAGAILGSGPGVHRFEDVDRWLRPDGSFDAAAVGREVDDHHAESIVRHPVEEPSALLARLHGLGGPVAATVTACAAANQALGLAYRSIRRGEADWYVSGGTDGLMNPMGHVFFVLLGGDARVGDDPAAACRPFDRRRTGVVMGEGAASAVLEDLEHARDRGAHVYAEVVGYGSSLCAFRPTAPHPEGRGAASAMAAALRDGDVDPGEVDFVCAHGTGTKRNDPAEAQALHAVFGEHTRRVSVAALKGALGHLLAGAAGAGFVCSVLAAERDLIPPTVNLTKPEAAFDLDLVIGEARRRPVRVALNNGFGFGGQNSSIAVRKYVEGSDR